MNLEKELARCNLKIKALKQNMKKALADACHSTGRETYHEFIARKLKENRDYEMARQNLIKGKK